jgi:hypothetical protein
VIMLVGMTGLTLVGIYYQLISMTYYWPKNGLGHFPERPISLSLHAGKHISISMRTTFDLPDELMKRAKIAAVKRGSTLRDLVAEALRRLLADQSPPERRRMTEAPIKLPPGTTIPIRTNREIARLFEDEDAIKLNDVYRGR